MNVQSAAGSSKGNSPKGVLELNVLERRSRGLHQAASQGPEVFSLTLSPPEWDSKPGQFVMIRPLGWELDPVWARPLSIARQDEDGLTLLVQVAGRGTARLAGLEPGDKVALWGPLGNTFAVEPDTPTLMAAGGIGLAPFLGYSLRHPQPDNLSLLFGHRVPGSRFPLQEFPDINHLESMHEAKPGDLQDFITRLEERMQNHTDGLVLACGPTPFLKTVQRIAVEHDIRCQLSLENTMACGIGACLGCVVPDTLGSPLAVCTRGPIFWADAIDLLGNIGHPSKLAGDEHA